MKIVFLLTLSLERPYGLGRCFPLAREMVRLGHDVTIVAPHHDFGPDVPREFVRDGVQVFYVAQMHVRKRTDGTSYFGATALLRIATQATVALVRKAVAIPADVYHIGKPHPMNGMAGLIAARFLHRRPLYFDCDDYEAESNRFTSAWQRRLVVFFEDRLPRLANGLTVNTSFLKRRYANLGVPSQCIVHLPNGVDTARFGACNGATVETLRRKLGLEGRKVIVYVGSMSLTNHPLDLLLEAFVQVSHLSPEAHLVLVGGGEDLNNLQQQAVRLDIADRLSFIGWVRPDEIPPYFALAEISVDPVRDDEVARSRWPLKVMESLAMGVPVVTGDVGDRREMLANGKTGLLVQPGSAPALAEAMLRLLRDEELRAGLSASCKQHVSRYSWDKLAQRVLSFYETTIAATL